MSASKTFPIYLFALFGIALMSTPHSQATPIDQARSLGVQVDSIELGGIRGVGRFLYEAARSEQFAGIEVISRHRMQNVDGPVIEQRKYYELKAVSDTHACWSATLPNFGRFGNFNSTQSSEPMLFQPPYFDREFVNGRCVIGYPIEHLSAGLELGTAASANIRVRKTSLNEEDLFVGGAEDIWEFFDVARPRLLDPIPRFGKFTTADKVSDERLVQAIEFGGKPLDSALNVIIKRASVDRPRNRDQVKQDLVTRVKPTGDDVINALLKSEVMLKQDTRLDAIWTYVAIGPSSLDEEIMEQLVDALEDPILDNTSANEIAWQSRVEQSVGVQLFEDSDDLPAHENHAYLSAGAELALTLNGRALQKFARHYEDSIRKNVLDLLIVDQHIIRVAAAADYRDEILRDLLEKSDQDERTPPSIQSRIEILITQGPRLSEELTNLVHTRCAQPQSLVRNGDVPRGVEFCREHGFL